MLRNYYMENYMENHQNNFRQEKKYILYQSQVNEFERNLIQNGFKLNHLSNIINNIYFDTSKKNSMQENINGDNLRSKHRIRWYDGSNRFVLEEKIKLSSSGFKKRIKLKASSVKKAIKESEILTKKKAVIQNSYLRQYYIKNGIRVTIDRKLNFKIPLTINSKYYPNIIVEIKFDTGMNYNPQEILVSGMKLTKFSKFLEGLTAFEINTEY